MRNDAHNAPPGEANARLIAAAPEMYALLRGIVDNRGECFIPNDKEGQWNRDERASTILAKIDAE